MKKLYITILLILLSAKFAISDEQTLVVNLDEPILSKQSVKSEPSKETKPPVAKTKSTSVKVGMVGLVCVSSAGIYQAANSESKQLILVTKETSLAIVNTKDGWYGVLMSDGSTGWICSNNISITDYQILANKKDVDRGLFTSRGSGSFTSQTAQELLRRSNQYSKTTYVYGGTNPATGMDCSAYVQKMFLQYGIKLPRTSREQAKVGSDVAFDKLQAGDRLYFACKNSYIDHCGIYLGDGYFIHCSSSKNGVGIDALISDFFWKSLVVAKRS